MNIELVTVDLSPKIIFKFEKHKNKKPKKII
jgi:hypothetical protein